MTLQKENKPPYEKTLMTTSDKKTSSVTFETGDPEALMNPDVPDMPPRLIMDLRATCNLKCPMCLLHGPQGESFKPGLEGEISHDQARKILDEVMAAKPLIQPQMYGEPLLTHGLKEHLLDMKSRGMSVAMNSNGLTLTDDMAEFFVENEIDAIFFSIDSVTPETLKKVRGIDKLGKVEEAVHNRCQQVVLEVTQDCNMRCRYCVYSGRQPGRRGLSRQAMPLETAFHMADDVLRQAIQGITELITEPGIINLDFAHVKKHMKTGGGALMSMGIGEGPDRVEEAIQHALEHPLLDAIPLEQATGVIANFTGSSLALLEVTAAMSRLETQLSRNVDVVWGVVDDDRLGHRVQVILVITGLGAPTLEEAMSGAGPAARTEGAPSYLHLFSQPPSRPRTNGAAAQSLAAYPPGAENLDVPAFLRRRTNGNVPAQTGK